MKFEMKYLSLMTLMTLLWNPSLCVLQNQLEMCSLAKVHLEFVVRSYGTAGKELNLKLYQYSLRSLAYEFLKNANFENENQSPDVSHMMQDFKTIHLENFNNYAEVNMNPEEKNKMIDDSNEKEAKISEEFNSYEQTLSSLKSDLNEIKNSIEQSVEALRGGKIQILCQQMKKFSEEIVKSKFDQNIDIESGENGEDLQQLCRSQELIGQDQELELIRIKNFYDVYRILQESQVVFEEKLKILDPNFVIEKNEQLILYVEKLKNDYKTAKKEIMNQLEKKMKSVEDEIKKDSLYQKYITDLEKAKEIKIKITDLENKKNSIHEKRYNAKADSFVNANLNMRLTSDRISDILEKPYKIDAFYRAVKNNKGTNDFVPLLNEANDSEKLKRELDDDSQTFLNIIKRKQTEQYDFVGQEGESLVRLYTSIIESDDDVDYLLGVFFADLQTVSKTATYLKCFSDETFASVLYYMSLTDIIRSNDRFLEGFFDRMPQNQSLIALRRILYLLSDHSAIEEGILHYAYTAKELKNNSLRLGQKVYSTFIEFDLNKMFLFVNKEFKNRFWAKRLFAKMKSKGEEASQKIYGLVLSGVLKVPMFYFLHFLSHTYLLSMSSNFAAEFMGDQILEYVKELIMEHYLHPETWKDKWNEFTKELNNLKNSVLNTEQLYSLGYQNFIDLVDDAINVKYINVISQMKQNRIEEIHKHFLTYFNGTNPVIMVEDDGGNNLLRKEVRKNLVVL